MKIGVVGLPSGWEQQVDPRTGRTFYINHQVWDACVQARASTCKRMQAHARSALPLGVLTRVYSEARPFGALRHLMTLCLPSSALVPRPSFLSRTRASPQQAKQWSWDRPQPVLEVQGVSTQGATAGTRRGEHLAVHVGAAGVAVGGGLWATGGPQAVARYLAPRFRRPELDLPATAQNTSLARGGSASEVAASEVAAAGGNVTSSVSQASSKQVPQIDSPAKRTGREAKKLVGSTRLYRFVRGAAHTIARNMRSKKAGGTVKAQEVSSKQLEEADAVDDTEQPSAAQPQVKRTMPNQVSLRQGQLSSEEQEAVLTKDKATAQISPKQKQVAEKDSPAKPTGREAKKLIGSTRLHRFVRGAFVRAARSIWRKQAGGTAVNKDDPPQGSAAPEGVAAPARDPGTTFKGIEKAAKSVEKDAAQQLELASELQAYLEQLRRRLQQVVCLRAGLMRVGGAVR